MSRAIAAATLAGALALALAACGASGAETTVNASGEDAAIAESIQAELDLYREPIELSILPPDQQAQVGEAIDQFPQAAGTVTELTVTDGVVEARTGLGPRRRQRDDRAPDLRGDHPRGRGSIR